MLILIPINKLWSVFTAETRRSASHYLSESRGKLLLPTKSACQGDLRDRSVALHEHPLSAENSLFGKKSVWREPGCFLE